MLGAAGGHADYGGNEVNALRLNADLPQWVQLRAPTPNDQIASDSTNGVQFYKDLRPSATHTYQATQFVDSLNRMLVVSSPGYNGPGAGIPAGWPYTGDLRSFSFNLDTGDWDAPDYIAIFPGDGDFTSALCVKHPWTGDIYYSKNYASSAASGIYKWAASTNTWTKLPGTYSRNPWYAGAAIDPVRSRMIIVGGYSAPPEIRGLDGLGIAGAAFRGLGASELTLATQYTGVCYDEANDCYWVLYTTKDSSGTPTGQRLLKVNAADFFVSDPGANTRDMPLRPNGVHNSVQYVPELKGLVFAPTYDGNVFFMRTA